MPPHDPSSPPPPENSDGRPLDQPIDSTRDATGADISPEIELRHTHEITAAEFPEAPSELKQEATAAEVRSSRRGCVSCVVIFVILAGMAAVGNWIARRSGSPTVSIPNIAHLPSVDIPTFKYPDISGIPLDQPGVQPPTVFSPQPTPHSLPDDLGGVLRTLEPVMRGRFEKHVQELGLNWPPKKVRLVGLKMEKRLELWAADQSGPFRLVKVYPVFAASGDIGPKRREGDKQVPEGHYRLIYLNPTSKYHLSLLLDYPNRADKAREAEALADGSSLGGDICVHGSAASIGCLAIGDPAIEEVFTLVALAKQAHRDIIILPADLRKRPDLITLAGDNPQLLDLYKSLSVLAETVTPADMDVTTARQ